MSDFLHALKAEWLKGQRTFLRYSPMVFAAIPLACILPLTPKMAALPDSNGAGFASEFLNFAYTMWIVLLVPIYCLLLAALNFQPEHTQSTWKHVNVQPVSGTAQTLAKHTMAWAYLAVVTMGLAVFIMFALATLNFVYPNAGVMQGPAHPWFKLFQLSMASFLVGLPILAILNVVSARCKSIVAVVLMGTGGFVTYVFMNFIDNNIVSFIPWASTRLYLLRISVNGFTFQPWWYMPPFFWAAASLAVHIALQRKKPLY